MKEIDNYLMLLKEEIRNNSFGHLPLKLSLIHISEPTRP